jgi:hypothetical protein
MVRAPREVHYIVAYGGAYSGTLSVIRQGLDNEKIKVLSGEEILKSLTKHANRPNLKIQNQLLRTIQMIELLGKLPRNTT